MTTIVCIASGPSLTAQDCELVRRSGLFTIVVNTSYRLAPWADVLYAGDRQWWNAYGREAKETIAQCWTASADSAERFWLHRFEARDWENSGFQAIELAIEHFKAERVILLGYDMQHTGGARHWHPDHAQEMGNADDVQTWPARFHDLRERFMDVDFVNCTRQTALTCFKRRVLEDELCVLGS